MASGRAVDTRGFLQLPGQLPEEGDQCVNSEGEREGDVGDDQGAVGADPAEVAKQLEQWCDQGDSGEHGGGEDDAGDDAFGAEVQTRDGVGGEHTNQHREERGDRTHQQRVSDGTEKVIAFVRG